MKCKNCSKELLDTRQKFCSINCQDDYIEILESKVREATQADSSHTKVMSFSE